MKELIETVEKKVQLQILKDLAEKAYLTHKMAFEEWEFGEPVECWFDKDGNVCVKYSSGAWFHYRNVIDNIYIWW